MIKINLRAAPMIMGVLNVTPDSFSDGGQFLSPNAAIHQGILMAEDGAQIIDVGGESTRPGAAPITPEEERARILPVVKALSGQGICVSVDTRHATTMAEALEHGASMINDITALTHDPSAIEVIRTYRPMVCLMHMQGTPQTMQKNPLYTDVVTEVFQYLNDRVAACLLTGIEPDMILADPGIGFGKTLEHNLMLLNQIEKFHALGVPLLMGVSRKSFIDKICPGTPPDARLPGSLASVIWGYQKGVQVFRVHDVRETRQALAVFKGISSVT
ncbi:MAG: dihydropteroate synthase [Alphaproteobacteria bacterium]|nr:dihydropteroate synthase [Alphaproteobacteria bacterium]